MPFVIFATSKKKVCALYGKWTECLHTVDPAAFDAHKRRGGEVKRSGKPVRSLSDVMRPRPNALIDLNTVDDCILKYCTWSPHIQSFMKRVYDTNQVLWKERSLRSLYRCQGFCFRRFKNSSELCQENLIGTFILCLRVEINTFWGQYSVCRLNYFIHIILSSSIITSLLQHLQKK